MTRTLHLVFFLSGVAALIYQVCWQQVLGLYYGIGTISTAIVVSIFLLGLGTGALAAGRISSKFSNSILAYVAVEALIGLCGLGSVPLITAVGRLTAGSDYSSMLVCVTLLLFVPTALMGATLPLAVTILQASKPNFLLNVSSYYFVNTLGAAFGAVFCSYFLISFIGLDGAVYIAVLTNAVLAVVVFSVSKYAAHDIGYVSAANASALQVGDRGPQVRRSQSLILLFTNGFVAIGYQIIWYRIVGVILKDSTYSFSTTLAIYLFGIGVGSILLNRWSDRIREQNLLDVYLWLNVLIAVTSTLMIATTYLLSFSDFSSVIAYGHRFNVLPFWGNFHAPHDAIMLASTLAYCILWPAFLMFIPTVFMGAAFPLGITLVGQRNSDEASAVRLGYAVTIAGNTSGGLVTSFILLPAFGTITVFTVFVMIQTSYVLMVVCRKWSSHPKVFRRLRWTPLLVWPLALVAPTAEGFYRSLHPPMPGFSAYFAEGSEGIVLAYRQRDMLFHWINGSAHGGWPGYSFVNEAVVALSYSPDPKRVLVVGFGTGKLVEAVQLDARVEMITIAEINRTAVENLVKIAEIKETVSDRRIEFVFDDARRFLERSNGKWDLVAIDPLRSRSAFSNNLYSVEFFELVKRQLSDHGVFLVWTDDPTGVMAKTLAGSYDHVDRYAYFFVACRSSCSPSAEIYSTLIGKLAPASALEVQKFAGPVVDNRRDIIHSTVKVPINRDLKPNLEYYIWQIWNQ